MGKLITVDGDKVEGPDKHNVSGSLASGTGPYSGIGDFEYKGKMADQLSDFVNIGGTTSGTVAFLTPTATFSPRQFQLGTRVSF